MRLRGAELRADAPTPCCASAGTGFAGGAIPRQRRRPAQCVRIMTGAVMPTGSTPSCRRSSCRVDGDACTSRPASCAPATTGASPARTSRAASPRSPPAACCARPTSACSRRSAMPSVPVIRRLRVAFFSTGDELRSIGEPLTPGCVYDSNRYTLWAMLQRLGVEVIDLGVVRDDPAALEAAFAARPPSGRRGDHLGRRQRRRGRPHTRR